MITTKITVKIPEYIDGYWNQYDEIASGGNRFDAYYNSTIQRITGIESCLVKNVGAQFVEYSVEYDGSVSYNRILEAHEQLVKFFQKQCDSYYENVAEMVATYTGGDAINHNRVKSELSLEAGQILQFNTTRANYRMNPSGISWVGRSVTFSWKDILSLVKDDITACGYSEE